MRKSKLSEKVIIIFVPTNAQYVLSYLFYSTATCFDVNTSSSGSLLLCTVKLQLSKVETATQVGCYKELTTYHKQYT